MWKAVGFGLAGIPLGFAIGGGLMAIVAATVLVSVAGAVNWGRHHMGARPMCEPTRPGVPARAYAAVAGGAVAVLVVHAALPFLLPAAAVLAVLAVAVVPLMRLLARRVTVPRWSAAYTPPARRQRASRARARAPRRAITAGQPMLEGKTVRVVPGMIVKGAAKEEARHG